MLKIKQKLISKKWFILMAIILLLIPLTAHAETPTVSGQAVDTFDQVLSAMVKLLVTVLQVLQKFLWPVLLAIGGLLNNDLLFGYAMEERLLEVWVQVRNLVNIGFVLMLLGIALWNVTGFVGKEEYQLKKFLPKFIIALIAINFSFAAAKVVLDVSNVMTHVVFSLPTSISDDLGETKIVGNLKQENKICAALFGSTEDFKVTLTEFQAKLADPKQTISPAEDPSKFYCALDTSDKKYKFTAAGKEYFGTYTSRNAALILAVQMMNIVETDKLTEAVQLGQKKVKLSELSFQILFSVVLYFIYAVAYIVLFIVLIARLVYLWVLIALSPLMVVKLVLLPNLNMGDKDLFKEFINNAFVPVVIGIPLTIGYIMLDALKSTGKGTAISTDLALKMVQVDNAAISDLQTLVIAIGAVAVVWVGVFAAARMSIASNFIDQYVKGSLTTLGSKAVGAARFLPIIPGGTGTGGRTSIAALQKAMNKPFTRLANKYGGDEQPLTQQKIRKIARGTDVEEAKKAFNQGIDKPRLQKELYALAHQWKGKTGAQGKFAKKVFRNMGKTDQAAFKKGSLRSAARTNVLNRIGRTPVTTPPARTSSASGRTGTGAAAGAAVAPVVTVGGGVRAGQDFGMTSATDPAVKKEKQIRNGGPDNYTDDEKIRFTAINNSKDSLTTVQNHVAGGGIGKVAKAKDITDDNMTKLKEKVTAAKAKLKTEGMKTDAEIKDAVKKLVMKSLGNNHAHYNSDKFKEIRKLLEP